MYSIPIQDLPFFPKLVKDYLSGSSDTTRLYSQPPNLIGLKKSLDAKEKNYSLRDLLCKIISENYPATFQLTDAEKDNLSALQNQGFAITTAHQPNLFLGPLYTITKAISAISLANKLNTELGGKRIVPIYVIGSEDHDQEELLHSYLFGKKYVWETTQKGPIGSMKVDENLLALVEEWTANFGNLPHSIELAEIYHKAYRQNTTIARATQSLLRSLFSEYGLIILDLNYPEVKSEMRPIFERELTENFAQQTLQSQLDYLRANFSVQAEPRYINLFEYKNEERIRIDNVNNELLHKLKIQPERFSPNVILRPLMQQMILPSIANIGGGAEVAYWLQLKPIFDSVEIDFPVIILRDLFSPIDKKSYGRWTENNLTLSHFFAQIDEFKKNIALSNSNLESDFKTQERNVLESFSKLQPLLIEKDRTLDGSYQAEFAKLQKSMEQLYLKAVKAEKRKEEEKIQMLEKIKNKVIENNYLTERKENFSTYYLQYGKKWIESMLMQADPLKAEWKLDVI